MALQVSVKSEFQKLPPQNKSDSITPPFHVLYFEENIPSRIEISSDFPNFIDEFTIECWIYADHFDGHQETIIAR